MNNIRHIKRLIKLLFKIEDFPALDKYFSKLLGRKVRYSWKIFRQVAVSAQEGKYREWKDSCQIAYFSEKRVPTFTTFCTLMLHECVHGLCYFLDKPNRTYKYPNNVDEEQVCHKISKMICEKIGVKFANELAELAYKIHKTTNPDKVWELVSKIPAYIPLPPHLVKPS